MKKAVELGLKSKVEQIEAKLSQIHSEVLEGAASIAEAVSSNRVLEEYQHEVEKTREELQR